METAAPSDALPVTIVPRWEWRTFGASFGAADERLAALVPERVEESDERYLLALRSDASVKVRGGRMDVKHLERVHDNGLELWRPVMKAAFPLPAAGVQSVLDTLRTAAPPLERPAYTLDELLDEIVRPSPELLAVAVHKRRARHTIGGCMAEVTEISADGRATRTIAVESEDPERVIAAVRELGLEGRPIVCVARGLKALVGFGARRYAVIDVGTNSVKFHVGERSADGATRAIVDRAEVTRLGEGLDDTGRLGAEPIGRTVDAIAAMADEARRDGAEAIAAVGTAGLRIAPNAADLLDAVEARSGIRIEVISGEDEARLAYLAAKAGLGPRFAAGRGRRVRHRRRQLPVHVRPRRAGRRALQRERRRRPAHRALRPRRRRLRRRAGRGPRRDRGGPRRAGRPPATGRGGRDGRRRDEPRRGAPRPGDVRPRRRPGHGARRWPRSTVRSARYRERTAEERRAIVGLQPNRAEVILAGACIVRTVLAKLGRDALTVSDRGLRHGVALERFGA